MSVQGDGLAENEHMIKAAWQLMDVVHHLAAMGWTGGPRLPDAGHPPHQLSAVTGVVIAVGEKVS